MTDLTNAAGTPVLLIGAPVLKTTPDADLFQVCAALAGSGVSMLVIAENSHVEGVVSERDVVQALADRRDRTTTRAKHIANTSLVWCDAQAAAAEVAEQMMESYVRHVLVEDDGKLVGAEEKPTGPLPPRRQTIGWAGGRPAAGGGDPRPTGAHRPATPTPGPTVGARGSASGLRNNLRCPATRRRRSPAGPPRRAVDSSRTTGDRRRDQRPYRTGPVRRTMVVEVTVTCLDC